MKQLFTNEELKLSKSEDLLPLECLVCGKTFYKTKHYIKSHIINPHSPVTGNCCSPECANIKQIKNKIIKKICPKCGKEFETISGKNEKSFCSSFCSHSRIYTKNMKNKLKLSLKNSEKSKLARLNRKIKDKNLMIKKTCPICKNVFEVRPCESKKYIVQKIVIIKIIN